MWCLHIGTKADLPALIKLGTFQRTFRHIPKAPSSKAFSPGVCHLCLAGKEGPNAVLFEDLQQSGSWSRTLFQEKPWPHDKFPAVLKGVPIELDKPEEFFRVDCWHCWHAGVGKVWLAASLVVIQYRVAEGNSVDSRFEWLTEEWRSFCREHKICPHVKEINRKTMSFPQSTAWPEGHWSKGQATTHLMMFLEHICNFYAFDQRDDILLALIAPCWSVKLLFL